MLIKTKDRKTAYYALINDALKDKEIFEDVKAVVNYNKEVKSKLFKDTGAVKDNSMRLALKIPESLLQILDNYERQHGGNFLGSKEEIDWFAKNFPMFAVPRKY